MDADPVRGDRGGCPGDGGVLHGQLAVDCAGDAGGRPLRAGDGLRRQGHDARCAGRPGRPDRSDRVGPERGEPQTGDRPRPDPVHPGQCRGTDQRHHRIRCQVRRPGDAAKPKSCTAVRWGGTAFEERQHGNQHRLRKRRRPAQHDRPAETERRADRGRRRRSRAR
ncbi:Uncharacterised protein [Mycobacterium tuberculosis]|nr:Uncharacterised protein [Mycobacterium tuberculosis]